ncbi:MAG: hydantoinase B/oxoprolinase family protein [Parvularculaceae bacterium]
MQGQKYGRDTEIVQHMRPEPMTAREEAAQAGIDDTEFEIFKHKMHMIALEGKETTMKLGASTAMRWGDVAFGIFTGQGDLSVCATGIYHHAVLGQIPIKYLIKHWVNEPSVGCKEGDSYFYNDPFYAGVHNADMGLSIPVFYKGTLLCFVGAAVHTGECGGSEPGGTVTAARANMMRASSFRRSRSGELSTQGRSSEYARGDEPRPAHDDPRYQGASCGSAYRGAAHS